MLPGLILTAFLMGLGGVPHCLVMCGAACAAAMPKGVPLTSLIGRCMGYALLGSVAAASSGLVAQWGRQVAFVQPLWVLLQALAVVLGGALAVTGRMPVLLETFGQDGYRWAKSRWAHAGVDQRWPWVRPALPFLAGLAWAALPCGLLYAALMVAALAPTAAGGSLVMLAFSVPGAFGVWAAPAFMNWLATRAMQNEKQAGQGATTAVRSQTLAASTAAAPVIWLQQKPFEGPSGGAVPSPATSSALPTNWLDPRWAVRLAGLMLASMAAWALYHQVLHQWRAWCA
jgi:sulfite exporter TauE/SafE